MEKDKKSMLESYLRGLAQDASMGYSDEIAGGLEAAKDVISGDKKVNELTELYKQHRDESRQEYEQAKEDNPKSYTAGELTGAAGSMLIPGGIAKTALKGAKMAALERIAKSGLESYGRAGDDGLELTDLASAGLSGIPLNKMNKLSKDIPWRTGKGVKLLDEAGEGFGKVIQKVDPKEEMLANIKGKIKVIDSPEEMLGVKKIFRNTDR